VKSPSTYDGSRLVGRRVVLSCILIIIHVGDVSNHLASPASPVQTKFPSRYRVDGSAGRGSIERDNPGNCDWSPRIVLLWPSSAVTIGLTPANDADVGGRRRPALQSGRCPSGRPLAMPNDAWRGLAEQRDSRGRLTETRPARQISRSFADLKEIKASRGSLPVRLLFRGKHGALQPLRRRATHRISSACTLLYKTFRQWFYDKL